MPPFIHGLRAYIFQYIHLMHHNDEHVVDDDVDLNLDVLMIPSGDRGRKRPASDMARWPSSWTPTAVRPMMSW